MNRELKISTASSRLDTLWKNTTISWRDLITRFTTPVTVGVAASEYHALPKGRQGDLKDVGGFVGGHLAHGRRRKGNVLARSIMALDLDTPEPDLLNKLPNLLPAEWVVYSTISHTSELPRYRLILPLARDVSEDEYEAVGRRVAADIGIDQFDDTTFESHRLMYWPTAPTDVHPVLTHNHGPWIDPDHTLARYDNWADITTWPTSSRQAEHLHHTADKQADPLSKPGLVGAFCRTYDIHTAITDLLSDVYEPAAGNGRYTYKPGETSGGVITYADRFAYSHHGTDPAGGQLLNAFDLVRTHRYGGEDDDAKPGTPASKTPSYRAMLDLLQDDEKVKRQLAEERVAAAQDEFTITTTDDDGLGEDPEPTPADWMVQLEITKSGDYADTLDNLTLILTHDPRLQEIRWNQLTDALDIRNPKKLPWDQVKPGWSDADIAQLKLYLEQKYHLYSGTKTAEALSIAAAGRAYHPIRDYLDALPNWDGVERLDTLLVDYLGAPDTDYTRAVTRKTLVAGVARVMRPGIKHDTVLILNGPQGTGKSTLFEKLAGQWFSDALTLTDMRDKTGAEKLQGYWILELGELAGMRKMEVEVVKGFLSRTDDKFRAAYARTVESHPRQCIIVGSTNAENGFLRDVTGNRRFWPVQITGVSPHKSWELTADTVDQLWAEALHHYTAGEQLHLSGELAEAARQAQDGAIETDDRIGLVEAYLETLLPEGWERMDLMQRRAILGTGGAPGSEFGKQQTDGPRRRRQTVSNIEIWAECFGQDPSEMQPQRDSQAITAIMQQIPGWEKATGPQAREQVFPYGRQRVYRRIDTGEPPF